MSIYGWLLFIISYIIFLFIYLYFNSIKRAVHFWYWAFKPGFHYGITFFLIKYKFIPKDKSEKRYYNLHDIYAPYIGRMLVSCGGTLLFLHKLKFQLSKNFTCGFMKLIDF